MNRAGLENSIQTGARGFCRGVERRKPRFTKFLLDETDFIQPFCTSFTFVTPLRISLPFYAVSFGKKFSSARLIIRMLPLLIQCVRALTISIFRKPSREKRRCAT